MLRSQSLGRMSLLTSSVIFGLIAAFSPFTKSAVAETPVTEALGSSDVGTLQEIKNYQQLGKQPVTAKTMQQVTSVSQLSDVQPTDWAFQALQSLVERYGCIAGYPNRTFRGNRPLTRYEFAAGLNACMDRINELVASATADMVTKEDLDAIKKLQDEFAAELATLKGRVDALEAKITTLEAQQFSTTTKLAGEVIFALSDAFSGPGPENNQQTVLQPRVRLNFLSSFTGKDLLYTRLQSSNAIPLNSIGATGTNVGQFTYNVGPTGNDLGIDYLSYKFPIGKRTTAWVIANAGLHHYYTDTLNPFLEGGAGGNGALSKFAERNPIYRIGAGGSGIGFNFKANDYLSFQTGYLSNTAQSPAEDRGLFNGNYTALAQAVFSPTKTAKIGLTYVRSYDDANRFTFGGVGTAQATLAGTGSPVEANSFGIGATWRALPKLQLSARGSYTDAQFTAGGDADIWSYAASAAFPDLGWKGNVGALIVGAEPYRSDIPDNDVPIHVEASYKVLVNKMISVTPGVIWVTAPRQDNSEDDVLIGTIRTTFTF